VELRRSALAITKPERGLLFWLVRQQRDWRRGGLMQEQTLLLTLAGVDLDLYTPKRWRAAAHEAAHFLMGSQISPVRPSSSLLSCWCSASVPSYGRPFFPSVDPSSGAVSVLGVRRKLESP
jgi:hypothetical protein